MKSIIVMLAEGFEEIETLTVVEQELTAICVL